MNKKIDSLQQENIRLAEKRVECVPKIENNQIEESKKTILEKKLEELSSNFIETNNRISKMQKDLETLKRTK